jgi:hypothetical protein
MKKRSSVNRQWLMALVILAGWHHCQAGSCRALYMTRQKGGRSKGRSCPSSCCKTLGANQLNGDCQFLRCKSLLSLVSDAARVTGSYVTRKQIGQDCVIVIWSAFLLMTCSTAHLKTI